MAISDRLKKLVGDYGPELCKERACRRIVTTEVIRYPDGSEERVGEEPPELCSECPHREGGGPIRQIEVVRQY